MRLIEQRVLLLNLPFLDSGVFGIFEDKSKDGDGTAGNPLELFLSIKQKDASGFSGNVWIRLPIQSWKPGWSWDLKRVLRGDGLSFIFSFIFFIFQATRGISAASVMSNTSSNFSWLCGLNPESQLAVYSDLPQGVGCLGFLSVCNASFSMN